MQGMSHLAHVHDIKLVIVAGIICILAAVTTFAILEHARAGASRSSGWIVLAAFVAGIGIWSTHFLAMLAYDPDVPVGYDPPLTLLSVASAIALSGLGLWISTLRKGWFWIVGGAVLGTAIGTMHFIGMAAMTVAGRFDWHFGFICASLAIGMVFSAAALAEHNRRPAAIIPWRAGLLLSLGICGLHFTGMAAMSVHSDMRIAVPHGVLDSETLGIVVVAMILLLLSISYFTILFDRINDHREAALRVAHLAYNDSLTGLANRAVFREQLEKQLERARRADAPTALLLIDLDGFKAVNDLHGHPAGDDMLVEVGRRLRSVVRGHETIARLGGDEFAVIQEGGMQPAHAVLLAERIIGALEQPFFTRGHALHISGSIGVSVYPWDAASPDELIKNADLALYRAKADGRGATRLYEAAMDEAISQRRRLAEDLRAAIDGDELTLHYQPIADLESGSIVGFEALLRWFHPNLGSVSPDLFVRIAEETGLIIKLGEWVIREAFEEAAAWDKPLKLSVNLSPLQFIQKDLARFISGALSRSGLDPARLEVEVTESILISDNDLARELLEELRAMGIQISLDDFGTGFSSLAYFRDFQFDKVKVDKSFVSDIATSENARAIIRSIVNLGRNLGIVVVAEGVETTEQLEALRTDGCTQVQGFLIGRPNPIGFAEGIIVNRRREIESAASVVSIRRRA